MKSKIRSLVIGVVAMVTVIGLNFTSLSFAATPDLAANKAFNAEVEEGLDYFRGLVREQMPLVKDLRAAIASGNLAAAKQAYVDSRPPYEQIEVFAGSFEDEDSDIDARPYGFDDGEESPDFKGFHLIEAYLYRDGDLRAALSYADGLIDSIEALTAKLDDSSNFSAESNFEGMVALVTEVPAKKISSEEETWSDQSILIFDNNWKGIYSQYKPFASRLPSKVTNRVDAAYQACMASISKFKIPGQVGMTPYSQVSVADRGKISASAYEFRSAILEARDALGLG
ncbi:MAG: EfeM/EfeO family lipoprotein [Cyanobacteria bacterium P01_C01_bin.89]